MAFTMLCVNLKGTCSGQSNVSPYNKFQHAHGKKDISKTKKELQNQQHDLLIPKKERRIPNLLCLATKQLTFLNKQLKSTWTQSPHVASNRIFSPWRSPRPRMWPTIHITAEVRQYVRRLMYLWKEVTRRGWNWLTAIRQADRPPNRLTDRQTGRPTDREMNTMKGRQKDQQIDLTNRQTGRQTVRQIDRQADRETERDEHKARQADRRRNENDKQVDRQTDRQAGTQTNIETYRLDLNWIFEALPLLKKDSFLLIYEKRVSLAITVTKSQFTLF